MEPNNFPLSKNIIEKLLIVLPITLLFSNILSEAVLLILILFYLSISKLNKVFESLKNPIIIFLLVVWFYLIFNYFINYERDPSFERTFFFIRFPLIIIAISFFINNLGVKLEKILFYWMIVILITCLDIFFQKNTLTNIFGFEAVLQGSVYRLGGFMNDELKISNIIFNFGALVFCYFFSKNFTNDKKSLYFTLLFLLILVTSIFFTAERSNLITILSFTLILILFLLFFNRKLFFILFFSLLIILSVLYKTNDSLSKRMIGELGDKIKLFKLDTNEKFLAKNSHYFAHYATAYEIFKQNKIYGVGIKNFRNFCDNEKFNEYIHPEWVRAKCATHPHSFYFEILSELGLLGFILILAFFIFTFFKFFQMYLKSKNIYLILSSSIVIVYFIPFLPRGSFFTNWNAIIFWVVFAFIYSNFIKLERSK